MDARMPAGGDVWRHFKGGLYTIVGMAVDKKGEVKVIYTEFGWKLAQPPPLYVRGIGDFLKYVVITPGDIINKPILKPRFKYDRTDPSEYFFVTRER